MFLASVDWHSFWKKKKSICFAPWIVQELHSKLNKALSAGCCSNHTNWIESDLCLLAWQDPLHLCCISHSGRSVWTFQGQSCCWRPVVSCWGGVTRCLVKFVATQTCQLLRRLRQFKCVWLVKTLTASNSFTSLQGVTRRKRLRQVEVKESVKLSVLLSKWHRKCKLSPGSTYQWA